MLILGIETSCDDTCAALVEVKRGKFRVVKNVVASQANLHKKYGGVVPEVAARKHVETIIPVINEALNSPSYTQEWAGGWSRVLPKLNAIAVTSGPGLITSLHVGVETAKALSFAWSIPLIGVNHIEGHIYSPLLSSHTPLPVPRRGPGGGRASTGITFPAIALVVSGGHTELILMTDHGKYKLLGRTRDDAAGEAFDKSAKMLSLGYPGGPEISKRAEKGNPRAYDIPRPMIERDDCEFSFSGMKNAIRLLIQDLSTSAIPRVSPISRVSVRNDLSASIEQAIVDILINKSLKATEKHNPKTFILAGGVAANKNLRKSLKKALPKKIKLLIPNIRYCQDNAAMIAATGYFQAKKKKFTKYDTLTAHANWELVE